SRSIACLDSSFMDDDHPAASHLHLRQNVRRKQNCMLVTQVLDQLPHLSDLVWIEADCRLIQNQQVRFSDQRVRESDPLSISLGEGPDQLVLNALETTKFFYVANTLTDPTMLDSLKGCAITQVLCYPHVAVEWHVFRHVAEMRSCL